MKLSLPLLQQAARTANAVSVAYNLFYNGPAGQPWTELSSNARADLINGVANTVAHDLDPRGSHELWLKSKLENGWRLGEEYNVMTKIHPDLKPYDELSDDAKIKDVIFIAIAKSFFPSITKEDIESFKESGELAVVKASEDKVTVADTPGEEGSTTAMDDAVSEVLPDAPSVEEGNEEDIDPDEAEADDDVNDEADDADTDSEQLGDDEELAGDELSGDDSDGADDVEGDDSEGADTTEGDDFEDDDGGVVSEEELGSDGGDEVTEDSAEDGAEEGDDTLEADTSGDSEYNENEAVKTFLNGDLPDKLGLSVREFMDLPDKVKQHLASGGSIEAAPEGDASETEGVPEAEDASEAEPEEVTVEPEEGQTPTEAAAEDDLEDVDAALEEPETKKKPASKILF